MVKKLVEIGSDHHLTAETVSSISYDRDIKIRLSPLAKKRILASRKIVEGMIKDERVVYGITTGFGSFKNKIISADHTAELQKNLIRSHAAGVGNLLSAEEVRAAMLVRLNSLAQGYSGVRLELLDLLCALINNDITPAVPSKGSVGSSGDLAPLSHIALVLMGEGHVVSRDKIVPSLSILKKYNLSPITFAAKEGLAFNNGTSVMTGIAAIAMVKAKRLSYLADITCALTLEAVCGASAAFDKRIHDLRPHFGQQYTAGRVRNLIAGSKLVDSMNDRVQDSYSLRCTPQVHGAIFDTLAHVEKVLTIEINSVTDNPIIFADRNEALSGGNFHGEPIAIAFDSLGIAISELGNISERRTAKLVDPATNAGLPAYLISEEKGGLHSGLMIAQYTAAALVSENKVLEHPASVDSIPTSANQEDHVSMGTIAVRKSVSIIENVEYVLAIELLSACQALDFRNISHLGKETKKIYAQVRKTIAFWSKDKQLNLEIEKARKVLRTIS